MTATLIKTNEDQSIIVKIVTPKGECTAEINTDNSGHAIDGNKWLFPSKMGARKTIRQMALGIN